ncbi:hypothetical protein FRC18_009274, partial [Serendipita sp. 400]
MDVGVRELDSCVPEELVIFDLAEGLALPRYQLAGMGPEIGAQGFAAQPTHIKGERRN